MNISIITPGAKGGYGGIAKYNSNLINFFIKNKKFKKIFLVSRTRVNYKSNKIIKLSENNLFLFFLKLFLAQIRLFKSDIILVSHINLLPFAIVPILFKKKVILCTYGLEIWGKKKNKFYQILLGKIKYFICMREYTKKILIKKYRLKNKFFYALHNAIKFRNIKIKKNLSKNLITIARLDKFEKYKGIDETLEALSKLKKINFKYNIVGDGNDKRRLINKTKKLNCMNYVNFSGKIDDKKRDILLNNSHIMIMPGSDSTFDTYPFRFIFLEAAEFGLHIIGSNPPDKKEKLYQNQYNSLNFVNPKNIYAIIKLIKKLQRRKKEIDFKLLKNFSINNFYKSAKKIFLDIEAK